MNLSVYALASLAEIPISDFPSLTLSHIHLSTVAVREGNKYTELPENISLNKDLITAVNSKNSKSIATEILKAFWSEFGLEHDEAIIIAFVVNQKLLPESIIKS